jgi:hypothetical protein
MVALKLERRVFLWNVRPRVSPSEAQERGKSANLDEIISILESAETAGTARVYLSNGSRILEDDDPDRDEKNQLYIAKIKRSADGKSVTLLVNRGDPNAVAPAFLNAEKNSVRVEHPKGSETPGWSAHLVIGMMPHGTTHRACFEQMPRVSSSIVLSALDHIVARALAHNPTYTYDVVVKTNGKNRIVARPYRPALDAKRIPSENLLEDLNVGSLSSLTLTKRSTFYEGIGAADSIRRQEQKVLIKLKPSDPDDIKALVEKIVKKAKEEDFESVTFGVDDLPGNQSSHPTIPIDDQDAMEHLYVRAKRLTDFQNILEQCYSDPCDEIEERMTAIVIDDTEWPN